MDSRTTPEHNQIASPAAGGHRFTAVLFGGFALCMDGKPVSDGFSRAPKAKSLLEYLLFRRAPVPAGELYETFWPQGKSPKNALKVLVHRLRTTLAQSGVPDGVECIVQRPGGYQWNPELATELDAERFEQCYRQAMSGKAGRKEQAACIEQALGLYRGRFLPGDELWTAAPAAHFHDAYRKMVRQLCTFYKEEDRLRDLAALCRAALGVDGMDEVFHWEYLSALLALGRVHEAQEHYQKLEETYYETLGVQLPDELRGLKTQIEAAGDAQELDIDGIRDALEEKSPESGAFVCEYSIFKDLYRIEARCLERYGGRIFLGLLTLSAPGGTPLPPEELGPCMDALLETARRSLRKGDVLARFSASQYVLLLPTVTYENGRMVLSRIESNFARVCPGAELGGKLRPLRPLKEDA